MNTDDFDFWLDGGPVLDTGDPTVEAWLDGAPVLSTMPEAGPPEPPQSGRRRVAVAFVD